LKKCGRMAKQWVKERFGEGSEGSRSGRHEEGILEETYERIIMNDTTEEEYPTRTSEEVVGRSKPTMPEYVGLDPDVSATLQMSMTPHIK
jgi:hypothetical protein